MTAEVLDGFAGSGWGVALAARGVREHGIENMPAAIATRELHGMHTAFHDIWDGIDDPTLVPEHEGQIMSPPCQTFSPAGNGAGRKALDEVLDLVRAGTYLQPDLMRAFGERHDPRTALVLTPLTYAVRHRPRFVVLEQVTPVLPVWEAIGAVLTEHGYSVATGILNAEQYGVPQTRRRAILVARRDGVDARLPRPTHSRFYTRDRTRLDEGVHKWVSMSEALGWGMTGRAYPTVAPGTAAGGTDSGALGGSGARRTVAGERAEGRWAEGDDWHEGRPAFAPEHWEAAKVMGAGMVERYGQRPGRGLDEPAFTVRANAGGMEPGGFVWRLRDTYMSGAGAAESAGSGRSVPRHVDEPSHTITGGRNAAWIMRSNYGTGGDPAARGERSENEPAATVTSKVGRNTWVSGTTTVRVSIDEAAVLQSYPAGFEFAGNRSRQFEQVGNAVPPLLAGAILDEVL